jgi:thiol-disulfide isomerase/thioredoxin
MSRALPALFLIAVCACENEPSADKQPPPPVEHGKVEIVSAGAGEPATTVIQREAERAKADGRHLVVYVGAPWCEPCVRFHKAAAAGELDTVFPKLRLLEFDHDRDEARLRDAGCVSRLIPLFAKPDASGHCSSQRIEGSIKGDGAVAEITPRLRNLLR